jgi:hypothetical protein
MTLQSLNIKQNTFVLITKTVLSLYNRVIHRLGIMVKQKISLYPEDQTNLWTNPKPPYNRLLPLYVYLTFQTQSSSTIKLPRSNVPNV